MSNLSSIVKSIRNDMREDRGISGDGQRIEQLGWMLFLKIFDDKEKELELLEDNYKSPIPEKFKWRNWAANDEGLTGEELLSFIDQQLFPSLRGLPIRNSRAYMVREVLEGNNNYMKSGTNIRKVLNRLNEIDFNKATERHLFGEIYETILQELQSAGDYGEFYTPRAITNFIVDIINPKLGEKVLDPACGTGGYLTSVIEHLKKQAMNVEQRKAIQENVSGWEWKPLPYVLATTNLILHDIELPNISYRDALDKPLSEYREIDRMNVIIANPPFGGTVANSNENNFPANYRTKESADLFLILMIHLLKNGGRAGIVLPDGSLSGDGVKQRIRKKFLEDCNLHTIIRLPNSVFKPYATVATNLLFFEKGNPTKEVWYYQHTYPAGVKSYSKTNSLKLEELNPIKEWWNKREESEVSWKVSIDTIVDRNYDLDIKNPNSRTSSNSKNTYHFIEQLKNDLSDINSEIEEIIQSLTTLNNYDIKTLGELCFVNKGTTGIKKAVPGEYPLVTTGNERLSHKTFQFDAEAVCIPLVSSTGHGHASLKRVHYQDGKFALGSILVAVVPKESGILLAKFLYYYLNNFKDELIVPLMKGMANVSLSVSKIKTIKIAVPSIEKQLRLISLMEKCENLRNTLAKSFEDAEQMIKSALNEAFSIKAEKPPHKALQTKAKKEKGTRGRELQSLEEKHFLKRKVLATYIINQSLDDQQFGDVKFEKILHLADYLAIKRNLGQAYYQQAAGPYDNAFTLQYLSQVINSKWFNRTKKGKQYAFTVGQNHEKSLSTYNFFSDKELKKVNEIINYFKKYDYEQPEIISTLYAVWNNRIIRHQEITDALLIQDFYAWDHKKKRYEQNRLMKALQWMREKKVVPDGWGKVIEKAKARKKHE